MADPNTRQGKRTPVTLKIKFKSETIEQFIERYAVDVSQGGIFIRTKEPLAVGTQMRFEFQLRDASPLIGGEGTVVWTRENDPSRPAIAPGMGVRFDRLAEGSQSVLERILAEKAKQAPQRAPETSKPPLFTDTPTRVAPPPVQDALLGDQKSRPNKRPTDNFNEQSTPLPKPMPFHSDADEFPEEAFEEATKVRALDELIAQTADSNAGNPAVGTNTEPDLFSDRAKRPAGIGVAVPSDELAARRTAATRLDSTLADPPASPAPGQDPSGTSPGFASGAVAKAIAERDSAPGLGPPPARPAGRASEPPADAPRMLDTTPSPRAEDPMEKLAKTRLGMEPVPAFTRQPVSTPPVGSPLAAPPPMVRDAVTKPSGVHAIAQNEPTSSIRMPGAKKSSAVPLIILIFVLLAAAGAGVWFFVLRDKAEEIANNGNKGSNKPDKGSDNAVKPGSDGSGGSGGSAVADNGSGGSAAVTPGSAVEAPKGPMVDIEITANVPKATIEVVGGESGSAPMKTKLEKDKAYKVRVSAPGYATLEKDVTGGDAKLTATLELKPRSIEVDSDPGGALIFVDGAPTGHSTPSAIDLTKVQAAKKSVRITIRKAGYRQADKVIDAAAYTDEQPDKMLAKVKEKLAVAPVIVRPPPPPPTGSGSGSGSEPPGDGSNATPPPPPPPPTGSGSNEPSPDFMKDKDKDKTP